MSLSAVVYTEVDVIHDTVMAQSWHLSVLPVDHTVCCTVESSAWNRQNWFLLVCLGGVPQRSGFQSFLICSCC